MNLRVRILLITTSLLVATVMVTTTVLAWGARQATLKHITDDGILMGKFLARMARFSQQVPLDVETALGDHMETEAVMISHLVAIAEQSGLSTEQINAQLKAIAAQTSLDEVQITDSSGRVYLSNTPERPFTFDPDPAKQPLDSAFWPLLTGKSTTVRQLTGDRHTDPELFQYVGVAGIDQPRIVRVGYAVRVFQRLEQQIGLVRLVNELIDGQEVVAIRIVDRNMTSLARGVTSGASGIQSLSNSTDMANLRAAIAQGTTMSYLDGDLLKVIVPIESSRGEIDGATLLYLSTDDVTNAMRDNIMRAAFVAGGILAIGMFAALFLARKLTEPVTKLTEAAIAVKTEAFDITSLDTVATRPDEFGVLARTFQRMVLEVQEREQGLKQAKAALLQSEAHFRSLIENASDIITILTAGGTIRYGSPSMQSILGYAPSALVDRSVFELIHPDDRSAVKTTMASHLQQVGSSDPFELRLQHQNGTWLVLEAVSNNLLDDPSVQGIIVTLRDITER
ncbi:MAG TPA: PAS domain S-box protein, partial [Chroococcidiopsis sp.]